MRSTIEDVIEWDKNHVANAEKVDAALKALGLNIDDVYNTFVSLEVDAHGITVKTVMNQ